MPLRYLQYLLHVILRAVLMPRITFIRIRGFAVLAPSHINPLRALLDSCGTVPKVVLCATEPATHPTYLSLRFPQAS